jgi:hypothetical protein
VEFANAVVARQNYQYPNGMHLALSGAGKEVLVSIKPDFRACSEVGTDEERSLMGIAGKDSANRGPRERNHVMTRRIQRTGIVMVFAGFVSMVAVTINPASASMVGSTRPDPAVTAETVVAKLMEQNRRREARLHQTSYSAPRTYRIKDEKGNVRVEAQVLMQHRAPGTKEFKVVSKKGSDFIYGKVLKPLMDGEVEAAAGRSRHNSAITPDNYSFNLIGEDSVDGQRCFLVQATPKRADKYLFNGKIWIHANEFAIVKIAGQPAKSPSVMIKQVNFVRRYQKVGEFWLPIRDESVTQVRFVGKNVLTVDYDNYGLAQLAMKK